LLFVFVFYFQGAQGDDPLTAGIKLTPMAIGMLIASPLAGLWADRRGSRMLAALGMVVSAVALAGMTTLQAHSPYWQSTVWLLLVGIGSGMFNSPNTAAMMATVPAHRRGIAGGAWTMLQNTGAVISIAFVLAIVTAAVPKEVLFKIFSGLASGLSDAEIARAAFRREWQEGVEDPVRRREILDEALRHIDRQLELIRRRRDQIAALERELAVKRRRLSRRLRDSARASLAGREG